MVQLVDDERCMYAQVEVEKRAFPVDLCILRGLRIFVLQGGGKGNVREGVPREGSGGERDGDGREEGHDLEDEEDK